MKRARLKDRLSWGQFSHTPVARLRNLPDEEMERGPEAFYDQPRAARPAKRFTPEVEQKIQDHLKTGAAPSIAALTRAAARAHDSAAPAAEPAAEPETEAADADRPTYATVHARAVAQDLANKSAGRHGSRAGEFDHMPRSVIRAEFPHHIGFADEFDPPVLVKYWLPRAKKLIALKPRVCINVDGASGVIPGVHVVNMVKRGYAGTADTDDFNALLFNVAFRQMAERFCPPCAPYSGFLPKEWRWDRSPIHLAANAFLGDVVHVPNLEPGNPPQRGAVERVVPILKSACWEMIGYFPTWHVTTDLKEDPKSTRTKAAATTDRVIASINLDIDQLIRTRI